MKLPLLTGWRRTLSQDGTWRKKQNGRLCTDDIFILISLVLSLLYRYSKFDYRFPRVKLTIRQHWSSRWLGAKQARSTLSEPILVVVLWVLFYCYRICKLTLTVMDEFFLKMSIESKTLQTVNTFMILVLDVSVVFQFREFPNVSLLFSDHISEANQPAVGLCID